MARINKIFASGTIANVIFYELHGKPCARSRPARVRQTSATKGAASRFGRAKTVSRLLRQSLANVCPRYRSRALMYRVDAGLLDWMQRLSVAPQGIMTLPGFACTGEPGFSEWCRKHIVPVLEGSTLRVTLAEGAQTGRPAVGSKALLTLVVTCIDPKAGVVVQTEERTVEMQLPPVAAIDTVIDFDVVLPPGGLILLSAALQKAPPQTAGRVGPDDPAPPPVAVVEGWYNGG